MRKRNHLALLIFLLISTTIFISCGNTEAEENNNQEGPFLATGIKIGEVTQTNAIVWIRLTQRAERIGRSAPMPDIRYLDRKTGEMITRKGGARPNTAPVVKFPVGYNINNIEGASPGSEGQVRLKYKVKDFRKTRN